MLDHIESSRLDVMVKRLVGDVRLDSGGTAFTISRSCSCRANANSLLSIQEAAATSRGVEPRIPGEE